MIRTILLICSLLPALTAATEQVFESPIRVAMMGSSALQQQSADTSLLKQLNPKRLKLKSATALVVDQFGNEIFAKRVDEPLPIASITKLMTAMVILDSPISLQKPITITREDRDLLRLTGSRLGFGATLTREQLVRLSLMSSENRAASALARTFPSGRQSFIALMNKKARSLGMLDSRFTDPAGLDAGNVASARDLAKLVTAAQQYPLIQEATTTRTASVNPYKKRGPLAYRNTNRLLKNEAWEINMSKTGYINEAGRCLVMQADIAGEPLVIVLLNSFGKLTPFGDSNRIRKWIENGVSG